ncbi:caspase recruitment domain-containing protein 19 isoform X1 [Balaenoptera acutorostrata]|uniref:Caspase recruitment domain-containing protein 19 isoform X1 n=2 Tax=Balaenoptera acutorostrata TaxID=9767 RepID=A0ABM3TS25_BALAC|nr:caspase recruitment domain-containing protein 19 isoform X1 [Balaenoptera acutorostrata]
MTEQTYCDRLVQDMPFLTGLGRLSEQQVDRIILQLNRYYPQILSNKDAEKFRNPKVSLRVRLCDLLGHLQRSGERDCQEFYRALYIHAQPLHSCLPSRHTLQNSDCTELDSGTAGRELSDRGNRLPCPFSLFPHPGLHLCLGGFSIPSRVLFLASCWTDPLRVLTGDVPAQLTTAQGVSLSLEASGPLPALLGSGSCSRAFLPRTRGLPDLSRPGRRAGTPRLLLPPRWVLPGQASAQSSPDHGAEPCRMDGGLHLRPPTCGPAWQPCGSFPAMLTLSRSCVGSQWQAGPLGMGTPHHSGVGLAMP